MRGEYRNLQRAFAYHPELPPRARRILCKAWGVGMLRGTTSACAENTDRPGWWCGHHRNYLRVRGEYAASASQAGLIMELPPRARRIPPVLPPWSKSHGTTSACAENTGVPHPIFPHQGNYLRVRGEYRTWRTMLLPIRELPPRARRIPKTTKPPVTRHGTTSACAENTLGPLHRIFSSGNYLRVRGEYTFGFEAIEFAEELPPRARRIHSSYIIDALVGGTTSACAENTVCMRSESVLGRNYLRVRGEYCQLQKAGGQEWELPPRARRIP